MKPVRLAIDAALFAEEIHLSWLDFELHEAHRILRLSRAMTQSELADRSGVRQPALSDLETGRSDPRWSTIKHVWRALDCVPVILPRPLNDWPRRPAQWREQELDP